LDAEKTFVPLCDAIKSHQSDRVVAGFDMSEMERGVIGFYLDHTFQNVRTLDELNQLLSAHSRSLLIVNANRLKDLEPLLQGRTKLVFEYRPSKKTRSYQLYESL
jgi:hypothetical protein